MNVIKDGHHYQLLNLIDQWILNQCMQDEICGNRCVDCEISWWNPCILVKRDSSSAPSIAVLSLVHQTEDLALKSPTIMVNQELQEVGSLKAFSKFDRKFSNSKPYWLGDLYILPI